MKIAVYGTLRQGDYNHEAILFGEEPLMTTRLFGYDMYSNGAYPYVVEGEGEIKVEIYDVNFGDFLTIANMEYGAGYDVKEVETPVGTALLFVYPPELHAQRVAKHQIENGDWISWVRDMYPERISNGNS